MKKSYIIAIVAPLLLALVIARLMTPSATDLFMTKMKKYLDSDNVYSELSYTIQGRNCAVKQYKKDGNYYMQFNAENGASFIVNLVGDKVIFGSSDVAATATKSDLMASNSVLLLDKFSVSDIDKESIVRDKKEAGLFYNFTLTDGTKMSASFMNGVLENLTYLNTEATLHVSSEFAEKLGSNVNISYKEWSLDKGFDDGYKIPDGVKTFSISDVKSDMRIGTDSELVLLREILGVRDEEGSEEDGDFENSEEELQEHSHDEEFVDEDNPDFEELDF